jgi:hypothetical protein
VDLMLEFKPRRVLPRLGFDFLPILALFSVWEPEMLGRVLYRDLTCARSHVVLVERIARHVLSWGMAQLATERGARCARRGLNGRHVCFDSYI